MAEITILYFGPIVTVKEAQRLGLKRYFSGKPCPQGHISERNLSGGCIACGRIYTAAWRERNKDHLSSYEKKEETKARRRVQWRLNNDKINARRRELKVLFPEKVLKEKESKRKYYEKNRELINARQRGKQAPYDPQKRIAKQEKIAGRQKPNLCEICGGNHHKGIVFDHDHSTGEFRGWICDRCNKVLGLVKDSSDLLFKMSEYIRESNGKVIDESEKCSSEEHLCTS